MTATCLLPCPFCGSDKIAIEPGFNTSPKCASAYLVCHACHAEVSAFTKDNLAKASEMAVKTWNTRQPAWIPVSTTLPDADLTVLVYSPRSDEPVWIGYWDGSTWRDQDNVPYKHKVTHWMNFPDFPAAKRKAPSK